MNAIKINNARLIEWKTGIYLVFSFVDGSKEYSYDFFIMKKIRSIFTRSFLFMGRYNILVDDNSLMFDEMKSRLNHGVKTYKVRTVWLPAINWGLFWAFLLICGLLMIGINSVYAHINL